MKTFIIFMQQCHRKNDDIDKNDYKIYRLKNDFFWMNELTMCVHDALSCWMNEKIDNNIDEMIKRNVHCAFNWQNAKEWKQDHILI